jgi:RimJ/RimL family protein N-acetyltransferase
MACDALGDVVACAAAAAFHHADHALGSAECWWGMLATRADHRGRSLALIPGAQAMCHMHDLHGFTRFFTGVEPGNPPSEAVCTRMGLVRTGLSTLGLADPSLLPGGRMTK